MQWVNVVTKEGYEVMIFWELWPEKEAAGMDAQSSGDRDSQLMIDKVMIRLLKTVRGKTTIEDYHAQQVI